MRKATLGALEDFIQSQTSIIDQNAKTIADITAATGKSSHTIRRGLREHIANGKVEKVKKRVEGRLVDAYRNTVR